MAILKIRNKETGEMEEILALRGEKGDAGPEGYTPIKGIDYYTESDKISFESLIINEMATRAQIKPEFAENIDQCIDTTKLYVLPDGYIYGYINENESGIPDTTLTWILDTEIIKNNPESDDFGTDVPNINYQATDFLEINKNYKYLVRRNNTSLSVSIMCYDENKKAIEYLANILSDSSTINEAQINIAQDTKYIRLRIFTGGSQTADYLNSKFQVVAEQLYETGWFNTGLAFVPEKGKDYYTKEDEAIIIEETTRKVTEELLLSFSMITGEVRDDNTILLDLNLPDGEYTLRYSTADDYIDIGTITIGAGEIVEPPDTTLTWSLGTQINTSTGEEISHAGYNASNYIKIVKGYNYTFNKIDTSDKGVAEISVRICYYDENKTFLSCSNHLSQSHEAQNISLNMLEGAKYFRIRLYYDSTKFNADYFSLTATEVSE